MKKVQARVASLYIGMASKLTLNSPDYIIRKI